MLLKVIPPTHLAHVLLPISTFTAFPCTRGPAIEHLLSAKSSICKPQITCHALIHNGQDNALVSIAQLLVQLYIFARWLIRLCVDESAQLDKRRDRCLSSIDDCDAEVGRAGIALLVRR